MIPIVLCQNSNVSEVHAAFIFRVKWMECEKTAMKASKLASKDNKLCP